MRLALGGLHDVDRPAPRVPGGPASGTRPRATISGHEWGLGPEREQDMARQLTVRQALVGALATVLLAIGGSAAVAGAGLPGFSDVSENHPFHDEIQAIGGAGITTGYPDGT
ncbi:hypothetical protein B7486_65310, partial [cyanobacterium TDX16]